MTKPIDRTNKHSYTKVVTLPAFLASALINGDLSGLSDGDEKWVEAAEDYVAPGRFVDVGEPFFAWRNELPGFNLGADCATYTVLYTNEVES